MARGGHRLREEIFAGTYPPGGHLPELELSAALEVSRGPVREALRMLEREGLVQVIWHRGAKATTLTPPDILELDTLRGALEDLAVNQVVRRANDDDFAAIDKAADAMLRSLNSDELVYSDIIFHDAVFDASHYGRLIEAWQGIRRQVHLFLLTRIAAAPRTTSIGCPANTVSWPGFCAPAMPSSRCRCSPRIARWHSRS